MHVGMDDYNNHEKNVLTLISKLKQTIRESDQTTIDSVEQGMNTIEFTKVRSTLTDQLDELFESDGYGREYS